MAKGNNIGILTGGGDVPGLNSVIKSVVYRATEMGRTVTGIRKGWKGLTNMNHADTGEEYFIPKGLWHGGEPIAGTRTIHAFGGRRASRAEEADS